LCSHRRLKTVAQTKIPQLGGYPAGANMVMWRGLARLTDIDLGFMLGSK
jgi:hypothetical protein